jgi:hypothetical protein
VWKFSHSGSNPFSRNIKLVFFLSIGSLAAPIFAYLEVRKRGTVTAFQVWHRPSNLKPRAKSAVHPGNIILLLLRENKPPHTLLTSALIGIGQLHDLARLLWAGTPFIRYVKRCLQVQFWCADEEETCTSCHKSKPGHPCHNEPCKWMKYRESLSLAHVLFKFANVCMSYSSSESHALYLCLALSCLLTTNRRGMFAR